MKFDKQLKRHEIVIYGMKPVLAAAQNPQRKIRSIFAKTNKIAIRVHNMLPSPLIDKLIVAPDNIIFHELEQAGIAHQGVLAIATHLSQPTLKEYIANNNAMHDTIICTNGVTDCGNMGAIARSAVAFGINAIIATGKAPTINSAVAKASAGCIECINYIQHSNVNAALILLKECGYWVYLLDSKDGDSLFDINFAKRSVLVVGSEGRGASISACRASDAAVHIPMNNGADSLNVAAAVTVALYENAKQRAKKQSAI